MAIFFGLAAAAAYGAADFLGGLMSRRVDALSVVFLSQLIAAPLVLVAVPFFGGDATTTSLGWGAAAGVAGGTGVLFFYRGLARGRMSVVAPITAVEAAAVPVVFSSFTGELPSVLALIGLLFALLAVGLISITEPEAEEDLPDAPRAALIDALVAGLAFGAFFITLDRADTGSGMWPLLATRISSLCLVGLLVVARRRPVKPPQGTLVLIGAAGILDVAANVLFVASSRGAVLSVAAVLTSMYPAGTVLLARIVLHERFTRLQLAGLALGALAVVLITVG